MKIETKIFLKIGQKTLEMTTDEARQLRDELNKVVGDVKWYPHYYPTVWAQPATPPIKMPITWTTTYLGQSGGATSAQFTANSSSAGPFYEITSGGTLLEN